MGGRGSRSPGSGGLLPEQLEALPYNVISDADALGGAVYPFLEQTGRAWRLLTRPVGEEFEYLGVHTFAKAGEPRPPTLRWVNGDQVNDLYVDGMDTEAFLAATGLRLDLRKGAFVLSKRLSRLMRPHFVSGFFEPDEVRVAYMEQDARDARIWDGAGLISRRMLEKMTLSGGLSPEKREKILYEIRNAGRVEFTVVTEKGQDKGHAIVARDLRDDAGNPVDFLLPRDTKREIRLENGSTFVGVSFVHGHDQMRLDIQSLINLHPFFEEKQLLGWLRDEGALFVRSIEDGTAGDVMGRIDAGGTMRNRTLADIQSWPLREYLVSGGHPMWFRSHVKSLMNQHLKRLNHSTLEKMRLPIPGGRFYVMPEAVARRAGIKWQQMSVLRTEKQIKDDRDPNVDAAPMLAGGQSVPRGHVKIDARRGTAWVNDEDWLALTDSPAGKGIAGILGGADHDDALWLYPFTDYDGERKVLAWRSPNQVGEYVVLRPASDSDVPSWRDAEGNEAVFPEGDSRRLPKRIDRMAVDYLGLVDPGATVAVGRDEVYTLEAMDSAVRQALANRGALGMYCNSLMVNKALFGRLPEKPPAPLEDIIDSAVKTGADLSGVVAWNYENSRVILEAGTPIPALLHHRLSVDYGGRENRPPPTRASTDHWLDGLDRGVRTHIQEMIQRRDELVARAMPPEALFESVAGDAEAVALGAKLNQRWAAALNRRGTWDADGPDDADFRHGRFERARRAVEDYLAHFPPERHGAILRGALVSVYGSEERAGQKPASDGAMWLAERKEGDSAEMWGPGGVGNWTIRALRDIEVLDEVMETEEGLLIYPNAEVRHVASERQGDA